ncbi:transport and Golgi organization protein 2 [Lutibacter sp. Hel_I_33_5]|uniref:NRDE family protein n=1 Tax=Lutibacter sp. Hel_I_33_5 TaxID=1566289 RepID=UPI0011A264AF|nr:NRDE family protein [Lutibacter sp. Hel_I_33_5]TVZ56785.1 transport and Golgi organization protein 2 [Lutibacter sp. Hel_I_33_5]
MCTLTYIPLGNNDFILTSNRDETPLRKTFPPKTYEENGVKLIYPKDELAGGTWIGLSDKKRLVCLLNGGFEKHQRKPFYKMSRGLIVKQLLTAKNGVDFINDFNFSDIEPFTLILIDWNTTLETYELVWDGTQKYFKKLKQEPSIWSSSTLYTDEMKGLRKDWFADWLVKDKEFNQEKTLDFHQNEDLGHKEVSLKMKRSFVETVSVTSIKKSNNTVAITYLDLLEDKIKKVQMI